MSFEFHLGQDPLHGQTPWIPRYCHPNTNAFLVSSETGLLDDLW